MKFQIDTDIPLPKIRSRYIKQYSEFMELLEMEVGHSVLLDSEQEKPARVYLTGHWGRGSVQVMKLGNGYYRMWRVK